MFTFKPQNGFFYLPINLFLFVLLCHASAQSSNSPGTENHFQYPSVSPAMAIIIVVLIAALFFIAFFSIYIRNRSMTTGSIRQTFSMRRRAAASAATRGLENSVIETFPTFTYAEVKDHHIGKGALECAVCLNEFEDDEMLRLIPKCDHVFHPECIDAWLKSHVTCPVCRADLTHQSDEPAPVQAPDVNREGQEQQEGTETLQQNNEVSIHIEENLMVQQEEVSVRPEVKRNLSLTGSNRPPRSFSVKRPRLFSKFRSHSTGHSLVVPGENLDRYTLRLPENVRKEVMNRALLNRTKSCAVTLPRHGSSRTGYRTSNGEGSNRGARSFNRIDREAKSDRWVFKIAAPFFTRGPSMKSPKVRADNEEGSTSRSVKVAVKMPSFKCLEPKSDEPGLLANDSARSPV